MPRVVQVLKILMFIFIIIALQGCSQWAVNEGKKNVEEKRLNKCIKNFCDKEPFVGMKKRYEAEVRLTRDQINSVTMKGHSQVSKSLNQELKDYNSEFEKTILVITQKCRLLAECRCINRHTTTNRRNCTSDINDYNAELDKAREFELKLLNLRMKVSQLEKR